MSENTISKIKIKDIEYELGTTINNVSGLQDILNSKSNTDHVHGVATTTTAGFMSAADKVKLDALNGSGGGEGGSVNIDTTLSVAGFAADAKAVGDALANKQDKLTFDTTPTSGSTNPVTSGGLFSKFATQDEEIKMAGMTADMAMPGSLKWDGHVGDRECVIVEEGQVAEGVTSRMQFVHVSDYVPEVLSLMMAGDPAEKRILTVLYSLRGMLIGGVHDVLETQVQIDDDMFIVGETFAYAPTDGYSVEGITFPKKGWYFISQNYCMGDIEIPTAYVSGLKLDMITFPDTDGGSDKYFESVNEEVYRLSANTKNTETTKKIAVCGTIVTKISSDIPDVSVFSNGYKLIDNVETFEVTKNMTGEYISRGDGGFYILKLPIIDSDGDAHPFPFVFVIPYDGFNLEGTIIPNSGVYFPVDLDNVTLIANEPRSVIKTEHLPKALQFGEITKTSETGGDTLTWDGKSGELIGEGLYKIADSTPAYDDFLKGFSFTILDADVQGVTIEVTSENIRDYVAYMEGEVLHLKANKATTQEFLLVVYSTSGSGSKPGIYAYVYEGDYCSSLTINGYTGFPVTTTELVKVDPKYLHQPDWNQTDETAADFIKNKPFGEVYGDTVTFNGETDGVTNALGIIFKVSDAVPTYDDIAKGGYFVMNEAKEFFTGSDFPKDDVVLPSGVIVLGHIFIIPSDMAGVEDPDLEIIFPESGTYFIYSVDYGQIITELQLNGYNGFLNTKQIEKKYIPFTTPVLYIKQGTDTPKYLYTNAKCTEKARKGDIPYGSLFLVVLSSSSGAPLIYFSPNSVDGRLLAESQGYARVIIFNGTDCILLYTAEYTPET